MRPRRILNLLLLLCAGLAMAWPVMASGEAASESVFTGNLANEELELLTLPPVDPVTLRIEDENRVKAGGVPHFAAVLTVEVDPWNHGHWRPIGGKKATWSLRLHSPEALSLSLAFGTFKLPPGARLWVRNDAESIGPLTRDDQDDHGQLWTPPMLGDRLSVELEAPISTLDDIELLLSRVHHGYAGFGEPAMKAGACHLEPACAEDDSWTDEARSVALLSIEGVRYCTGFLVNNTAQDGRPFLITARHCGVHQRNAASVVAMWRHERRSCDEEASVEPPSRFFQTGAVLRATRLDADITLLELDDTPKDEFGVLYAGWDRADDSPREGVTVHHPSTGHKRVAFAEGPLLTTNHLGRLEVRGADHLRVGSWRLGTTEGGSSGAPLFNEDRRVVGVLHGGYAACGNRDADWFGRLAAVWHGSSAAYRLRDWLDPLDLQPLVLDAFSPASAGSRADSLR